jgi:hypothetical protein
MNAPILTTNRCDATSSAWKTGRFTILLLGLSGCISVKAPDKPIEINLNINVKQEVVVSLKQDAADLITSNPELFPK